MKTKQEILDSYGLSFTGRGYDEDDAKSAMDEYAKQQSIAFEIWKIKEGWMLSSNPLHDLDAKVYYQPTEETEWLSVKELYSQFIEYQSQNK